MQLKLKIKIKRQEIEKMSIQNQFLLEQIDELKVKLAMPTIKTNQYDEIEFLKSEIVSLQVDAKRKHERYELQTSNDRVTIENSTNLIVQIEIIGKTELNIYMAHESKYTMMTQQLFDFKLEQELEEGRTDSKERMHNKIFELVC